MVWSDPWHNLFFREFSNATVGGHVIAVRSLGPGFWAIFAYCYALAAVSSVLLAQAAIRSAGVYRAQAVVMLFALLLPWTVDFLDMIKVLPYIPVDLVSPTFAMTGLTFLPALYRFHLLDLPPVAWAAVVRRMDDPVAVIDPRGRLVELNPAAEQLVGRKTHELAGVVASEAFGNWSELAQRLDHVSEIEQSFQLARSNLARASSFDSRISPLGDDVCPSGWVLVLRDITDLKHRRGRADRHASQSRGRACPDVAGASRPSRGRGGQPVQGSIPCHAQSRAPHTPDTHTRHRFGDARRPSDARSIPDRPRDDTPQCGARSAVDR